jgi:thioredoxin-dependent peroxiredoxin
LWKRGALVVTALALAACGPVRRPGGGTGLVGVNEVAPGFEALDQQGATRSLAEFRGHPVVLYFYPRDGTPGCTREACAFRDAWTRIAATGATVLGVSSDSVASHRRFADEHHLTFPLLADPEGRIADRYGVRRTLRYDSRVTFLIDAGGHVSRVYPNVDPAVHADEVVRALEAMTGSGGG